MKEFIAIIGGSFNLFTDAHLRSGLYARDAKGLRPAAVWYMVSPQNPHKSTEGMAAFEDRLDMAKAGIAGENGLIVTGIEKEIREAIGSTQTSDVLRELNRRFPDKRFAWVAGADCLAGLHTWGRYEYMIENVPFITLPRKDWTQKAIESPAANHPAWSRLKNPAELRTRNGWVMLDVPETEISATNGRQAIRNGHRPENISAAVYEKARHLPVFQP